MHALAVPISQSVTRGLALAETHPAQWVTVHNMFLGLVFREVWFSDCLCLRSCTYLIGGGLYWDLEYLTKSLWIDLQCVICYHCNTTPFTLVETSAV